MLLFHHFYLLIIIYKVFKISIVIINNFHLISSFVQSINVGPQLLLQSLNISGIITKILHRYSIANRIDDSMISLEFLNGALMEGSPMEIENDHDQ
jgi:hypothetical protein